METKNAYINMAHNPVGKEQLGRPEKRGREDGGSVLILAWILNLPDLKSRSASNNQGSKMLKQDSYLLSQLFPL
jgi:hypothetical protein